MKILGIDPGSNITGFGIIEIEKNSASYVSSGCINVSKFNVQQRMSNIYCSLIEIIDKYSPNLVAIESVFVFKNPNSALKLSQARGAALAAVGSRDLTIKEYSPREVKKYASGYGGASKDCVKSMVVKILSLNGNPQKDAADALGVALCCFIKSSKLKI